MLSYFDELLNALHISKPSDTGMMKFNITISTALLETSHSNFSVTAQWESARPNLDLPKIEAGSEVSAS